MNKKKNDAFYFFPNNCLSFGMSKNDDGDGDDEEKKTACYDAIVILDVSRTSQNVKHPVIVFSILNVYVFEIARD